MFKILRLIEVFRSLFENEDVKRAKDLFGTTHNPREAGFILPDGNFLDLSGQQWGGKANVRNLDHRKISWIWADEEKIGNLKQKSLEKTQSLKDFMALGAIRMHYSDPEWLFLNFGKMPNSTQMRVMQSLFRDQRNAVIEIEIPGKSRSTVIEMPTMNKVMSFLRSSQNGVT